MPDVNTADVVFPTITGVSIASPPVVSFRLVNSDGLPLKGLKANQVRFALAQLVPGTGGKSSEWKSYISRNVAPVPGFEGTATVKQATTETGADVRFTDNGDGTYSYRFSFDINAVSGVPYDATLTHRVALQISLGDIPVDNNSTSNSHPT